MEIKKGIDLAKDSVVKSISKLSKDIPDSKQIAQVATISQMMTMRLVQKLLKQWIKLVKTELLLSKNLKLLKLI